MAAERATRFRTLAAGVLATGLLLQSVAAAAEPRSDPVDAAGPLDLRSATLEQDGPQLVLKLRTAGAWDAPDLAPGGGRHLCLLLSAGGAATPGRQVCVVPARGKDAKLTSSPFVPGGPSASDKGMRAKVRRRDRRSLEARFAPGDAGLAQGRFGWQLSAAWTGPPGCPPAGEPAPAGAPPCEDTLPDGGPARGQVAAPLPTGCRSRDRPYRTNGPRDRRVVALTFDDGPGPLTPAFLDVLEREKVPGTFFLVGRSVAGQGRLLQRMLAGGHMLANHTYTHANVSGGGPGAERQMRSTTAAIRRAGGFAPCLFRAPYGAVSGGLIRQARGLGMTTIQWDLDPFDWRTPGAAAIEQRILAGAKPGSIVLMHDAGGPRSQTLEALPRVIQALRGRGYEFATVTDLLGFPLSY